jgi:hypothetical protein
MEKSLHSCIFISPVICTGVKLVVVSQFNEVSIPSAQGLEIGHRHMLHLLGFGGNNKKIMCYTTPNMRKDLSISNAVTVGVRTCTIVDQNAEITLPHKRWRWRRRSRPQDHEDPGATTLAPHEQHLRVLTHVQRQRWLPKSPFQPRCESTRLWTGIRKLQSTTACSDDDSLLLRSPLGGHAGVLPIYFKLNLFNVPL